MAKHIIPILLLLIGSTLSFYGFSVSNALKRDTLVQAFRINAQEQVTEIVSDTNAALDVLPTLKALFVASDTVTRDGFSRFTATLQATNAKLQALEWVPRVTRAQRQSYQELARQEGFDDFEFLERDHDGTLISAADREEYFPVYYVEPMAGNEPALGFDLGSNAARLAALNRARNDGHASISAPISLVQANADQRAFLAFLPVFWPPIDSVSDPSLRGFVLAVYRADEVFGSAVARYQDSGLYRRLGVTVVDTTGDGPSKILYGAIPSRADAGPFVVSQDIAVGGRTWRITVFAPAGSAYQSEWNAARDWIVLALGLCITLMASYGGHQLSLQRGTTSTIGTAGQLAQQQEAAILGARDDRTGFGILAVLVGIAVFAIDLSTELGIASGVAYIMVVWLAYMTRNRSYIWIAAIASLGLTALGFALSPEGGDLWKVVYNRMVTVAAISLTGYLLYMRQRGDDIRTIEEIQLWVAMTETMIDCVITTDEMGKIMTFNRASERVFKCPARDAIGQNISAFMPDADRRHHDKHMTTYRETGEVKIIGKGRQIEGQRADGSVFPFDLSVSRVARAEKPFFLGIGRDVSERIKAEENLVRTIVNLKRSNQELENFAYVASHDLKSPLRAIDNLSSWIEEDMEPHLDEENRERIALLRGRVKRMETLLDDLLGYARAGSEPVKSAPVDMHDLVTEVSGLLEVPEGLEISVDDSLSGLMLPRMPIAQVLFNLISNAVKHHDRPKGQINIAALIGEGFVDFEVTDDGPGIPQRYQDKIFEMFQVLHSNDAVEGSGMGLALIKKIVDMAGGQVWLQSLEGDGAKFTVRWPTRHPTTRSS